MMQIKSLALISLISAQSLMLYAEDIQVLVVEGKQSTSFQTSSSIKNTQENFKPGLTEASDILTGLPGLQIDSRSNFAQDTRISLRGFGARSAFGIRGIDLLVDGVPISTPDGQGQLSSVQLNRIQQVQVISGSIAALYGNSPGGVISFTTQQPEKSGIDAQFSLSDQDQQNALINAKWRQDNIAVASQINQYESDTDRPHSKAEREQASVAIYYRSNNDWDWIIKHDVSRDPLLQDPLGLTPQQFEQDPFQENSAAITFNTRKQVDNQQSSISLRKTDGDRRWQLSLWQSDREITQYLGFAGDALTSAGGVVNLNRNVLGINATLTQDFFWFDRDWQWSMGAELTKMQDDRQGFVNNLGVAGDLRRDEKGEVINRDIYNIVQFKPNDNIKTFIGFRYSQLDFSVDDFFIRRNSNNLIVNPDDSGEQEFSENAMAVGLEYQFAEDWTLFASTGKGYETPTLTEMAYKANGTGLNTDLNSSQNRQVDWGFNFTSEQWLWQISQFYIDTENEIIVDQSINGRTSFRNAQETQRRGIEVLNRYQFNDYWSARLSMQYLNAEFTQGEWNNHQLPGLAKKVYQADLTYFPFAKDSLSINLSSSYRDKVATADNNLIFAPSWQLWDFSLQGKTPWSNLEWWIRVNNVTNKTYVGSVIVNQANGRSFEPGLGRQTSIGLRLGY
ncbi:MAG: TonB-dependent receptor [Cellvibrio sp.]|nr:TonB-dependent receptor [Cellvibrio sp.]